MKNVSPRGHFDRLTGRRLNLSLFRSFQTCCWSSRWRLKGCWPRRLSVLSYSEQQEDPKKKKRKSMIVEEQTQLDAPLAVYSLSQACWFWVQRPGVCRHLFSWQRRGNDQLAQANFQSPGVLAEEPRADSSSSAAHLLQTTVIEKVWRGAPADMAAVTFTSELRVHGWMGRWSFLAKGTAGWDSKAIHLRVENTFTAISSHFLARKFDADWPGSGSIR